MKITSTLTDIFNRVFGPLKKFETKKCDIIPKIEMNENGYFDFEVDFIEGDKNFEIELPQEILDIMKKQQQSQQRNSYVTFSILGQNPKSIPKELERKRMCSMDYGEPSKSIKNIMSSRGSRKKTLTRDYTIDEFGDDDNRLTQTTSTSNSSDINSQVNADYDRMTNSTLESYPSMSDSPVSKNEHDNSLKTSRNTSSTKHRRVSIRTSFITREVNSNKMYNWLDNDNIEKSITTSSNTSYEKTIRISEILSHDNSICIEVNKTNDEESHKTISSKVSRRPRLSINLRSNPTLSSDVPSSARDTFHEAVDVEDRWSISQLQSSQQTRARSKTYSKKRHSFIQVLSNLDMLASPSLETAGQGQENDDEDEVVVRYVSECENNYTG